MSHLKRFSITSEYEAYIHGASAVFPNVSICDDDPGTVYYTPMPPDAVDLGLPSGTLWCSHNVGAETETEYGDYFMWGSVTPDTNTPCNWAHAPFNNGKSSYDDTYFASVSGTVCPNGILALEYDAARQIMGGNWRMPTQADWQELLDGTTNEWVIDYKGSGINGRLFTSKTNGKTLFYPAAGFHYGSSSTSQGSVDNLWSSSLLASDPSSALEMYFNSSNCNVRSYYRCYGFSVRGVMKK